MSYSVRGFLNSVLRRSGKTLLVEGPSDKATIQRLCIEASSVVAYSIDHAEVLGEEVSGLRNKERILKVREEVAILSADFPRLIEILAILTDREWDGLSQDERRLSETWCAPEQFDNNFTTLGHSIENYSFRKTHVIQFLKLNFSDILSPGMLRLVEESFPAILVSAACISVIYQKEGLLRRAQNVLNSSSFVVRDGGFWLDESVAGILMDRGVSAYVADSVIAKTNQLVTEHLAALSVSETLRWLPHGHAGEDAIWSCIAACLKSTGVPESACERIIGTVRSQGPKFFAHLISQDEREDVYPLRDVVDWLCA
ncbi:hypothetical protein QY702_13985 [Xanthomonas campestris pv. plantaginis]|uniref:hypothetical protein n=1 Tax=Xanthomonas campestris TaxID=339 RepID=UPI002B238789|nr:hypothetical protein [Xanthomonas campestris]MEA9607523.1 hypothetical protein [Xanthomonas campestris pv. plantaginis]